MATPVKLGKKGKLEYKRLTGTLNANNQATDQDFADILKCPVISAYGFYASNVYFSDTLFLNNNGTLSVITATIPEQIIFVERYIG